MKIKVSGWNLLLFICLLLSFFPLVWMISTTFKQADQIFSEFLNPLPRPFTWENISYVLNAVPMVRYFINSLIVAVLVTAFQLVTSILAAYSFTRFDFKGRQFLFYVVVASMLIPIQVTMLPNYLLISKLDWLNTYAGLVAPQLANGMGVFLLRQTFRTIPQSLYESAQVGGAAEWQILWRIAFPVVRPTVLALGVMFFINVWNEYFWPLLVINDKDMLTIPLALQLFINSEGGNSWGPMMAVGTLASLPPLIAFFIVNRQIVSSFISTGVKG
ncbi:carbohydrate ABC transporter permease [Brevibacillus massiliensis]|uniref:carbohydrate ABC transporter permease n=1 Tax=Brevibacillus massiliensis TaxID=1118054 RepID=UPI0002D3B46D|nr:carbohydrate ABC transporter permease [Brevibacillus massiliensis]